MTIDQAVISGVVQGVTEFFPISSSGHLVVLHSIFGLKEPELAFDLFLHFGSLVALVIFFGKDLLKIFVTDRRTLAFIIIGSLPSAIIGFLFKDAVERLFGMPKLVGYAMLITGLWLSLASLRSKRTKAVNGLCVSKSLVIGLAQGIAIVPGISRSGATIATAILLGLNEELAVRFSFLLAMPAIFGANLLKLGKIGSSILGGGDAIAFIVGAATAAVTGLAAIKILLNLVKDRRLIVFGIYCILFGVFVIALMK